MLRIELSFPEWQDDDICRVLATTVVRGREVEGVGISVDDAVHDLHEKVVFRKNSYDR